MEKKDGVAVRTGVLCFQCHEAEMLMVFAQDRILTTTNTIPAAIASVRIEEGTYEEMFEGEQPLLEALWADSQRVHYKVKEFESLVWFGGHDPIAEGLTEPYVNLPGSRGLHQYKDGVKAPADSLQEFIRGESSSGHSASFTNADGVEIKLLSLAMAARWRMTIQHPDGHFIDVITEEKACNRRMGTNGIQATADEAIALLESTIAAWKAGDITFTTDDDVRIQGS